MAEKVDKYGNDVMSLLTTSFHSVNKSCASCDSHNVVNLKCHVIFVLIKASGRNNELRVAL